jgi:DNA (cytosine-5)-methyltransferase 1
MKIGTDFSGIGSPEMALKLLNIEHEQVFACEIDKYARKSFEAIHGAPQTFYKDITKRDHSEIPQLDLYVAGFPCQAFSMAGKRKGFDDVRGTLFFNVAEFIKINQPKCFILENVKGLLSHDGGKTFQTIISLLTDNGGTANGQIFIPYFEDGLGYHVYYKVLNTKDYGIPQNRERIFIVGFKEFREFSFPKPFPLELRLKDMLQNNPDYKYFLSDKNLNGLMKGQSKPQFTDGNDVCRCFTAGGNSGGMHSSMTLIVDDKYFLSDKMINTLFTKDSGKNNTFKKAEVKGDDDIAQCLNHRIPKMGRGDNYIKVPSATKKGYEEAEDGDSINILFPNSKTRKGRVGKGVAQTLDTGCNQAVVNQINPSKESGGQQPFQQNRVFDIDGLSPAVLANLGGERNHNILTEKFKIRRLTPLECFRLQGFPDDAFFRAEKVNSDTQLYKQAGNSITTCVMVELFKKISYI